jgi:pilus assembly protein FimV
MQIDHFMPRRLSFQLATMLFACGLVARVHAAEIGDVKVNSFIGQHLSADIELTALDDPAAVVQVRLASLDVYRGANLDMPAVLASLNLSVMRREGKQFLHITSTRPVDVDHLHVYLELSDGGHKGVRLATLWFAPDPTPPAPPERVAIPMTVPAATPTRAPARKSAPIRPLPESSVLRAKTGATPISPLVRVASDVDLPQQKAATSTAAAPAERQPVRAPAAGAAAAPAAGAAAAPATATATAAAQAPAPAERTGKPASASDSGMKQGDAPPVSKASSGEGTAKAATPAVAAAAPLPLHAGQPARPALLKLAKAQAAPACTKQASQTESACVVLDSKNAELRAEIGKLEARVNTLLSQQNSHQAEVSKPAVPPPAAPAVPAEAKNIEAPAPAAAPSQSAKGQIKPALPSIKAGIKQVALQAKANEKKAEPAPGMPWGWIAGAGAAVFALVGALQFWRHRRKQPKARTVHVPLPDEEEAQVEPTLG